MGRCTASGSVAAITNGTLLPASQTVRQTIEHTLSTTMMPAGDADFVDGIETALDITRRFRFDLPSCEQQADRCETLVVWLAASYGPSSEAADHLDEILRRDSEQLGVRLITYALGPDTSVPRLEAITCAGRGWLTVVPDGSETGTTSRAWTELESVMRYLRGGEMQKYFKHEETFSEPYEDGLGLGMVMTVAVGCYSQAGELLGVAATDIRISALLDRIEQLTTIGSYAFLVDSRLRVIAHPHLGGRTTSLLDDKGPLAGVLHLDLATFEVVVNGMVPNAVDGLMFFIRAYLLHGAGTDRLHAGDVSDVDRAQRAQACACAAS